MRSSPFGRRVRADLVLDAGAEGAWTLRALRGRLFFFEGRSPRPTTTVRGSLETLTELLEGSRSGAEAWVANDLEVRGNISLAMQLEGMLRRESRPAHFPVPRRVDAGGTDTFIVEAGEGPPVVLLHGLGATNASMLPTLLALAHDHRVIAADIPGFGDSAKPIRAYHARYFARWAVGLLDALGIERAHFVGNSMGGRISIEVALTYPERVDRLALYAPAVAMRRFRQLVPLARAARPELAVAPIRLNRDLVGGVIRMMFARPERMRAAWFEAATDEFMRSFEHRAGRVAFFSALREIYLDEPWGSGGFWERLEALTRPALFLWGDRDVLVPAGFHRHVPTSLPEVRSIVLSECGHVPQFEHPEITHELVRGFLEGGDEAELRHRVRHASGQR